ncbi:GNAT family N-acetyltransferase [Paenibacillus sp. FSL R5-0490]|uniref:GNAT family N-acetyltransferase n=1 Tax=Paenibacillus sp. FSL R5-0490 TaxID=1920424 RepID=UPI00096F68E4|nr:GNAT family N-acetyltransferase [Paenibacillus sp. FSL R5-0490]OMF54908.1 GNAT family N-acetyltransferase [Paenibacillus sp. FSL R5-0490]
MEILIEKAMMKDAVQLTDIMKAAFDEEAQKWLTGDEQYIADFNIQPPEYDSLQMTKYMILELDYYKVIYKNEIAGGIIVTISGKSYGRIDRIFIRPDLQGCGIGSAAIKFIENHYPYIKAWELETSARQINNHHFYEKMGFQISFKTNEEYCYEKRTGPSKQDITDPQFENCDMGNTEVYKVNMAESSFSNSSLCKAHFSNCNLSHSKFQNINLQKTLFADLNLSQSRFMHVTLSGVLFADTNLRDGENPISFNRCNLEGSKITNCCLKNVEISESSMSGMKINGIPVEELLRVYEQNK